MKVENTVADFKIGQRVQAHPATDIWMRGARFGTVIEVTRVNRVRSFVRVKMDALPIPVAFHPSKLLDAEVA